jgi:hypothetical protein
MSANRTEEPVSVSDTARISNRLAVPLTDSFPIAEKIVLNTASSVSLSGLLYVLYAPTRIVSACRFPQKARHIRQLHILVHFFIFFSQYW